MNQLTDAIVVSEEATTSSRSKAPTLIRHLVTIERDAMTKIAVTVYDHELELLYEIEDEGNIEIVETVEIEVAEFDIGTEYDRLKRAYEKRDPQVVEKIFGRTPRSLASKLGMKYDGPAHYVRHEEEQSAQIVNENPAIKRVLKKAEPRVASAVKAKAKSSKK